MAMYPTKYHRPADLGGRRAAVHRMRGRVLSRRAAIRCCRRSSSGSRVRPISSISAFSRSSRASACKDEVISIGATTRHADVAASPLVRRHIPALSGLAGSIGDRHVRHRGTIGGSVANNDPAADYPAAVLGLGATVVTDRRRIAADDYFVALYETALAPGRDHHPDRVSHSRDGRLREIPQPRVALRHRGGLRLEVRGRRAGRGDGRRRRQACFGRTPWSAPWSETSAPAAVALHQIDPGLLLSDLNGSGEYRANLVCCSGTPGPRQSW